MTARCGPSSPIYFQLAFAFDRVKAMAPQHPEWKTKQPFKALLDKDMKALGASGEKGLLQIVAATHTGMTTDAFAKDVLDWMATARHPRFNRPYNELVYQPMLELLAYLRANGFKTFIVSGGGIEFMRPWVEKAYGIPPEQVVGSSGVVKFEFGSNGKPALMKLAKVEFIDDGPGKPVGINRFIGRRPIFAFGNSDGDLQMLQWTTRDRARASPASSITPMPSANTPTTGNRKSASSTRRWTRRKAKGWTVVDMKRDWKKVFAFEP